MLLPICLCLSACGAPVTATTGNTVTGGPEQITQAVQIDDNVSAVKANADNKKK